MDVGIIEGGEILLEFGIGDVVARSQDFAEQRIGIVDLRKGQRIVGEEKFTSSSSIFGEVMGEKDDFSPCTCEIEKDGGVIGDEDVGNGEKFVGFDGVRERAHGGALPCGLVHGVRMGEDDRIVGKF